MMNEEKERLIAKEEADDTIKMLRGITQKREGEHFDDETGRWGGRAWMIGGVVTLAVLSAAGASHRVVRL